MASKTIYVGEGGREVPAQLFNDGDYRELLTRKGIECLENEVGVQVYGYAGLENHGKYERGPSIAASAKGVAQGELPSIWWARDSLPWERDSRATTYINELLQAPQTQVGSLTVIEMKTTLQQDEQRTTSTLVIPSGTRGCWDALLNHTKEEVAGQRYQVTGTPGAGKSRSLNYLIREIIFKHRNKGSLPPVIVFEHRKDRLVWLFVPYERENPQSEYEAFSMRLMLFDPIRTAVLFDMRNYYIIDSRNSEETEIPARVAAKTIYSGSSDSQHFPWCSWDLQKEVTYYIPVWKEQEIFDAIPHMIGANQKQALLDSSPHQSLEEIVQQRMGEVGAIPRRVFSPLDYEVFKKRLEATLDNPGAVFRGLTDRSPALSSALCTIDVGVKSNTREPSYTSRVVHLVSNYARSRVSLDTVQALHNHICYSIWAGRAYGEYEKLIALMLLQHGFQGKMEEVGVPNPKTVELTIDPGGAWMQAGFWDQFVTAVKVQTTGAKPVSNVRAINLIDSHDGKRHLNVAAIQRLLKELELKEEDLHIVSLAPEGRAPGICALGKVHLYRATIPPPQNWKPFRRAFSTLRLLSRLF